MLKSVIVDDEPDARQTLSNFIRKYCPAVHLAGMADGVKTGIKLVREENPDLIFLDIRMNDGTGFDILDKLEKIDAHVVFTTAYEEFALKAIKYSALDYLLKPIDPDELIQAVDKIKTGNGYEMRNEKHKILKSNLKNSTPSRLVISDLKGLSVVDPDEIIRCQSNDNYTIFFLNDKTEIVASRTLKDFEEILFSGSFYRVHNSHLVNLKHIKKFIRDEGYVVMSDGSHVEVSKRRKNEFLQILNTF